MKKKSTSQSLQDNGEMYCVHKQTVIVYRILSGYGWTCPEHELVLDKYVFFGHRVRKSFVRSLKFSLRKVLTNGYLQIILCNISKYMLCDSGRLALCCSFFII